ncbi:hypothetical protein SDC9_129983 [bioreactor metagenome]|uniref:Uncharacterized protein n=1 Tax=bioreactor metagenome TaxID=1076179 RepID=A0A645D1C8_9ZZZZ
MPAPTMQTCAREEDEDAVVFMASANVDPCAARVAWRFVHRVCTDVMDDTIIGDFPALRMCGLHQRAARFARPW